jgi:dienelactone hydrolase
MGKNKIFFVFALFVFLFVWHVPGRAYCIPNTPLPSIMIDSCGNEIQTPYQWEQHRKQIERKVLNIIGDFPVNRSSLNPKVLYRQDKGSFIQQKISYDVDYNETVTAYLLIPKTTNKKIPAVLALHQTTPFGKDEVVGINGNPEMWYGLDLVKQGFVVLAPDALSSGERVYKGRVPYDSLPFYEKHPNWSMIGKAVWDNQRAIDYLLTLDFVDTQKIMVFGHSEGGVDALFLSAFDKRISAVVINCGIGTISGDPNPYKWCRSSWFIAIPKLRPYLDRNEIPFDFHELVALVAPCPLLSFSATNDVVFPHYQRINDIKADAEKVYGIYNSKNNLTMMIFCGNHALPDNNKLFAYSWLRYHANLN